MKMDCGGLFGGEPMCGISKHRKSGKAVNNSHFTGKKKGKKIRRKKRK